MRPVEAYRVLGVAPETSADGVKARYRQLVKHLHPDAGGAGAGASGTGSGGVEGMEAGVDGGTTVDLARLVEAYRTIVALPAREGRGRRQRRERPVPSRRRADGAARSDRASTAADRASRGANPAGGTTARPPRRSVIELGARATHAGSPAARAAAVRELGRSGRYGALVFLTQALFDGAPSVAVAAAEAIVSVPGAQVESQLIELFVQLSVPQRLAVLTRLAAGTRRMPRLVAYAAADESPRVRARAQELL